MGTYVLPQIRVFQEFARTPNDVTRSLNPFIIGPNYQLMRYSDAGERDDCTKSAYTGSDLPLPWATGYANSKPDKSWGSVTMADAYVALGEALTPASCADDPSNTGKGTKFEFDLGTTESGGHKSFIGNNADLLYFDVAVKAGDYVAYKETGSSDWKYMKIRDISCGTPSDGEISSEVKKKDGSAGGSFFTANVSSYSGEKSTTVRLHIGADKKLSWTSSPSIPKLSGTSSAAITAGTAVELGAGVTVTPTADAVDAGGDYVLSIKLIEPYSRDTVTLSDRIPTGSRLTFVRHVDYADVVDDSLMRGDDGITVSADACVDIGLYRPFKVVTGTAYLNQRNFRNDHSGAVYTLGSDAEIAQELGAAVPENPLAYAAHVMLLNSASKRIRYIGVKSNDYDGYADALKRASVTSEVYAFCPLTEDADIIDAIVADCNRLSTPEEKSWRIAIFSKPTEESKDVTPDVYGVPETCKVVGKVLTCYNGNTGNTSAVSKFTDSVRVGDTVEVVTTTGVVVSTTVDEVTTDTTLTLADEVPNATSAYCRFSITHMRDRTEYVDAIAATSAAFRDRRAYNVFPNHLRTSDGTYVSGIYAAAAVCALACSVQPQQPITNVEIKGFSDIPDVYSKFSRDELNTIAGGGTLILMQDKAGGPIYVRHQISTAYADGDLNSTELSLVKNLDSISYYFAERFAPYNGRYNLTDDLLTELRGILEDGLAHLETTTETDKLIGPQLIADGTEIRSLYRDPTEKDKAYANVALNLPAPFNNFDLHLQVI